MDEPVSTSENTSIEAPVEVPSEQPVPSPLPTEVPTEPEAETVSVPEAAPAEEIPAQEPTPASYSPQPVPLSASSAPPVIDSIRGNAAKKQKVEQHLERILAEAKKKKQITNRDVVKLLRVSDATASRYLKMLVVRSDLRKEGNGRSVRYSV